MIKNRGLKAKKKNDGKSTKVTSDDAAQAFLSFPPENLSISHSDIEQGFNKSGKCLKIDRSTILSLIAIFLAIICITLEIIKVQKILDNSNDIDAIKIEFETLKNRFYEEDLLDELKAFEEQLYADEGGTLNSDNDDDYDQNYEDYDSDESDYLTDKNDTKLTTKIIDQSTKNPNDNKRTKIKRFVKNDYDAVQLKEIENKKSDDIKLKKLNKRHRNNNIGDRRKKSKKSAIVRRNLRIPRHIFAAHYEADTMMFHHTDEHTGNGRAKHNEGIFKAWRPSDWMDSLGMNRYFTLSRDGRLTVHEPGVYLVYAQIHYLDEHDENGFHMLVDGQPILQCMVYSPGVGHKSRSCYSSQVTYLKSGDHIVIKDVGPARYTLFQRDKSFFGLTKLGDARPIQQQNQLSWHSTSPQPQNSPL